VPGQVDDQPVDQAGNLVAGQRDQIGGDSAGSGGRRLSVPLRVSIPRAGRCCGACPLREPCCRRGALDLRAAAARASQPRPVGEQHNASGWAWSVPRPACSQGFVRVFNLAPSVEGQPDRLQALQRGLRQTALVPSVSAAVRDGGGRWRPRGAGRGRGPVERGVWSACRGPTDQARGPNQPLPQRHSAPARRNPRSRPGYNHTWMRLLPEEVSGATGPRWTC
jgi:hypothetical protein